MKTQAIPQLSIIKTISVLKILLIIHIKWMVINFKKQTVTYIYNFMNFSTLTKVIFKYELLAIKKELSKTIKTNKACRLENM